MSRQAIIEREKKRQKLVEKYKQTRLSLKKELALATSLKEKLFIHKKIEKLPRNSATIRLRRRCWKTGRGRGVYRDFGLCRHSIRELAHNGMLPGVRKASW
jgi:small subunit ribosomal protein S14